jgi:acetyl esterase/lipase
MARFGLIFLALLATAAAPARALPVAPIEYGGPPDAGAGVLLVHGGGWWFHGAEANTELRPAAARLAALGFRTALADYHPFARSLPDVVVAYDALAAQLPPGAPVCAFGDSAGGQLALVLAVRRPALRCVVAIAAPTDLARLAADGSPGLARAARITWAHAPGGLDAYSPLTLVGRLHVPVLLAGLRRDPVVPFVQQRRFARAYRRARLIGVARGSEPFLHGRADAASLAGLEAAEAAFLVRELG